jgi:hypothetical protein
MVEALRLAGRCHIERGAEDDAYHSWMGAIRRGRNLSGPEIRLSSFMETARELLELLNRHGLNEEGNEVVAIIQEAGARANGQEAA